MGSPLRLTVPDLPDGADGADVWQLVVRHEGDDELDLTRALRDLAERAALHPETYRWSYSRDISGNRRVVVDSRAARVLAPDRRDLLDDDELAWLDEQMRGDVKHLFIGTSLPFLLPPGLHYLEAWSEAVGNGAWGKKSAEYGETLRQAVDLEHWAAFQKAFHAVARMATEVADGKRGKAPDTVTFLSGDVHLGPAEIALTRMPRGP